MGVKLTPLLNTELTSLTDLAGKKLIIDGCNLLFKYITKIRKNNKILFNSKGDPISHIIGVLYFCINLMERHIRPIFVFDGYPPEEKRPKSPEKIGRLVKMWKYYEDRCSESNNNKKYLYQDNLFLYDKFISDLQNFIKLMGLPVIRGLSEGEAQGARLVIERKAFGMITEDQDSLLFGCPRTFRKVNFKDNICYSYDLKASLKSWGITQQQLIEMALLIGTDYNEGIRGIGPKKALKLIREFNTMSEIPNIEFDFDVERIKTLFLKPSTIGADPVFRAPNSNSIKYYLKELGLSPSRIDRAVSRLRLAFRQLNYKQSKILAYF